MFKAISNKASGIKLYFLFITILLIVLICNNHFDDRTMMNHQLALQKMIGRKGVNIMLYDYLINTNSDGYIVTDYETMKFLPGFESRTYYVDIEDFENFRAKINIPSVKYVFVSKTGPSIVKDYLLTNLNSGIFEYVAVAEGSPLIRIR